MWLARTSSVIVQAHITMLSRLQAEEAIDDINEGALAAGTADQSTAGRLRQQLSLAATGGQRAQRNIDVLRQHGFAVRRVPKQKKPA